MADPTVTKSPKTSSKLGEKKLLSASRSTPKKSPHKRVVVDQFLVVPRDLSLSESSHDVSKENQQIKKSRNRSRATKQLKMTENLLSQPTSMFMPRMSNVYSQ